GAELGGLALALGLHPAVYRLAVLLRQIGATDAQVEDIDAEGLRLAIELLAHSLRQLRSLVAHDLDEGRLTQHTPQRRDQQCREAGIRAFDRSDRLVEFQRIVNAVAGK